MSFRRMRAIATQSLTVATVPKARRPKFDLQLKIIDLNNVPLVSGNSYVKWHLPHSTQAEHRGRTEKRPIKDHKVIYDYENKLPVRLTIDKSGNLQESWMHFEVLQEYSTGSRPERITLGHVKMNLAEYVDHNEPDSEEGICRRHLMQDSKINSTLKVSIFMKQVDGERNFVAPPLKIAPVFGGIAGIIAGEQADTDDAGTTPSMTNKSKETGELQDMYRRTLAAYWAAQPGELKADECIEDIFAGGDGWADREHPYLHPDKLLESEDSVSLSEGEPRVHWHKRKLSERFRRRNTSVETPRREPLRRGEDNRGSVSGGRGKGSLEQQASQMKAEAERRYYRPRHEVDEVDVRQDLCSWQQPKVA